jgi:hypothetical protein
MSPRAIVLIVAALVLVAGAIVVVVQRARRRRMAANPPQYWVGISVYEGGNPDAAAAAFSQLQASQHDLPGDREWMSGDRHVRRFKVV